MNNTRIESTQPANKVLVAVVLAAFLALHVYAFQVDGLIDGFITMFRNMNGWSMVLVADLFIALAMVATWIVRDAKKRGVSPIPYVALTLTTGSIGALLYLLRKN
jgi:hypothetical protein